jgi:serine/threonine protein kinase/tetratricopeptide (TPR) repeat protein
MDLRAKATNSISYRWIHFGAKVNAPEPLLEAIMPQDYEDPQKQGSEPDSADAHQTAASTPHAEAGPETVTTSDSPAAGGGMIGGYRIIREIGSGGMGIVYEAEQQHPKRLVALKVIQGGRYVDEHQIKLFEREAQALARLKHPGIAAIYESGRTPDGQHFFAMELVRGETLKEYLDRTSETGPLQPGQLKERLNLFRKIAEAVTYAHQRGVIHRDLKPSNIFVQRELISEESDSELPTPGIKVLDFGLARITETDLAVATVASEVGRIQGTLPYMSPEQVRGNPDEIDVRTDVYSLGVILYEMISGRRPYEINRAMLHEAVRIICESAPIPLSRSWSGTRRLDRDIETIVNKTLEKQPGLRYQSVSALGEDITRFLTRQPIQARPPNVLYQLKKMVVRHKVGFGFAAALVLLIVAFGVVMSIQAQRIARERDRASREAKISQEVSEFLVGLFEVSDPFEGRGKDVTAREILDSGSQRIATELHEQPEVRARLMDTMGRVYRSLGFYDKATELVQQGWEMRLKLYGRDSLEAADSLTTLGVLKMDKGDYAASEPLMREGLEIRRKRLGPDSIEVAESLNDLASLRFQISDWKESEQLFREAVAIHRKVLGSENLTVATSLNNLAMVLNYQEKYAECEAFYTESLSVRRKLLGNEHPAVAQSLNNLARLYLRQKKYSQAEPMFQQALAINRKAVGEDHPVVGANLSNLGLLYLELGQFPKAEEYYRQVLAMDRKTFGENHPNVAKDLQSLGVVLTRQRMFPEAERLLRQALTIKIMKFDQNHWEIATTKNLIGDCLMEEGRYQQAERLLVESYGVLKNQFGIQHDRARGAGSRLIDLYERWGKKDRAAELKAELATKK